MKQVLLYFGLIFLFACSCTNVLILKYRPYYEERSFISEDNFTLYQRISHNLPGIIDDEYDYNLRLKFVDTVSAKFKKTLNLFADTLIIIADYGITASMGRWEIDEENKVTGQIEILQWDSDQIVLREKIRVFDTDDNESKKFYGTRTFKKKDGDWWIN